MTRTQYDKQLLAELANGFSYQCVRQSPLWTRLQNREVDAVAEELAQVLIVRAGEWCEERAGKLAAEQHRITCVIEDCGFYANDGSDYCPSHY